MKVYVGSIRSRLVSSLIASALLLSLAACGKQAGVDSTDASAAPPEADAAMVADAAMQAVAPALAVTNPLCEKASYPEVAVVTGGSFDKVDVIDEPGVDSVECVFLDSKDLYAGLTIRFVATEKLVATASKWQTAAAYFNEWSRGGKAVPGLGESAVWADMPAGLLVQKGDHVLHFSASKVDMSDPAVRARFEALAQLVVARLP